ncbi:MAG: drug/metabolite exporter, EamA family [Anaerocolumna sp.]|jgi:drug/metabolite transporter (DMT)-like permease|nr:drug/metabolite exporter, EamA family [Anaerocolumna sp.]
MTIMNDQKKAKLYALGTIILWASAFSLTKIALKHFTGDTLGLLRYLVASVCLLVVGIFLKIGLPELKDIPKFFISGALGFTIYMQVFNQAQKTLTSATGSVLIATAPVITALLAGIFYKEKIKFKGWLAISVEFLGILILTLWDGVFTMNKGVYWMLGAAFCISCYNLFQRYYLKKYTALQATAYNIFGGTILLLFFLPKAGSQVLHAPAYQLPVILFLGIFPSCLAYIWWAKGLSLAEKTSDVTNFMFVTPFIAAVIGFLMIGETPTKATFIGGAIIIMGLLLFQRLNSTSGGKKENETGFSANENE